MFDLKVFVRKKMSAVVVATGLLASASDAGAVTFAENFESSTIGDANAPEGWSLITVAPDPDTGYVTTTGANGHGRGGQVTANHTNRGSTIVGAYLVNSASGPMDLTQTITGNFDFYIPEAGNYSSSIFFFGDIQDGIAEDEAGESLGMFLRERTFGARAGIVDGAGGLVATHAHNRIESNNWYHVDFAWNPTDGLTGDFSYTVSGANNWTESVSGYTFDSAEAWFGFGSGGYYSNDMSGIFDNITITGTALGSAPVPEPASLTLFGAGSLLIARRPRRG